MADKWSEDQGKYSVESVYMCVYWESAESSIKRERDVKALAYQILVCKSLIDLHFITYL